AASRDNDIESLNLLAEGVRQVMADDPKILATLAGAYSDLGRDDEAESLYVGSLADTPNQYVSECYATFLLRKDRTDEALEKLSHIIEKKLRVKASLLLEVVRGYQREEKHEKALELLQKCAMTFPSLSTDESWRKVFSFSAERMPKELTAASPFRKRNLAKYTDKLAWVAVIVLIAVVYLGIAIYKGNNHPVYLVNGIGKTYSVIINGSERVLNPSSQLKITCPEGVVTYSFPQNNPFALKEGSFTISTSFWTRPFNDGIYVINPDATAFLLFQKIPYASSSYSGNASPTYRYYLGQQSYIFDDIDYPFRTAPKEISIEKDLEWRTNLTLLHDLDTYSEISLMESQKGNEAVKNFIRTRITANPEAEDMLDEAGYYLQASEYLELLKSGLGRRPVLIPWHRNYQSLVEKSDPAHDLEGEYAKLLEKEPGNADLTYLLGRVTEDPQKSRELFRKANGPKENHPYATNALAFAELAAGNFPAALGLASKAVKLKPQEKSFLDNEWQAMLASGMKKELLARNLEQRKSNPGDFGLISSHIVLTGGSKESKQLIDIFTRDNPQGFDEKTLKFVNNLMLSAYYYAKGDLDNYARHTIETNINLAFTAHFATGKYEEAEGDLIKTGDTARNRALLYIAFADAGMKDKAEKQLAGIDEKGAGDTMDTRRLASMLLADSAPSPEAVAMVPVMPGDKRVYLTALGLRFPEQKDKYFSLAKKLNYEPVFPYLFLNRILK
ncbi:MAG: hypothetical protein JXR97_06850, partial [Planctomycetes bacterium]|nr:hypothetical protein [Planctomycetota bacterium]